eukprot:CAMPEP_0197081524 /NCGR_PEP_ID=MMETSP1384-20130603/214679_1 /TAXON_ID=29189 /ORGANISM="Ammonia sp." /LENGTH=115 /DNA_ID=CAMNT_0042520419 /DNA_START=401 /DNA_END=745 /DNA_ORIENTATION=-
MNTNTNSAHISTAQEAKYDRNAEHSNSVSAKSGDHCRKRKRRQIYDSEDTVSDEDVCTKQKVTDDGYAACKKKRRKTTERVEDTTVNSEKAAIVNMTVKTEEEQVAWKPNSLEEV